MTDQKTKAEQFKALHIVGKPLVLFNIWDAGSACAVASTNAAALATGSWSVAQAHGLPDGENISLDLVIANLKRIVAVTELPVSIDIESGYENPARTTDLTIEAGAVGCNLEDSFPHNGSLRDISEQAARIRESRRAADASGIGYFINARTDVFLQKSAKGNEISLMPIAIERALAYAEAGADGIFVPGLTKIELITQLAAALPVPVNIMVVAGSPDILELAGAGIARISHGPTPYLMAMEALARSAERALLAGTGKQP